MENIIYPAEQVWDVYMDKWLNPDKWHDEDILIAENDECGVQVYINMERLVYPSVIVLVDDEEIFSRYLVTQKECEEVIFWVYDHYVSNAIETLSGDDIEESYQMDFINDREAELDDAIFEMLSVFAPEFYDVFPDIDEAFDEIKDIIGEYLYARHNISMYRPMYLDDDSYSETPYSEVELEWFAKED